MTPRIDGNLPRHVSRTFQLERGDFLGGDRAPIRARFRGILTNSATSREQSRFPASGSPLDVPLHRRSRPAGESYTMAAIGSPSGRTRCGRFCRSYSTWSGEMCRNW